MCMRVCMYVCNRVWIHVCTNLCMYKCMHVLATMYMRVCTYTCMNVCKETSKLLIVNVKHCSLFKSIVYYLLSKN